jgi:F420-dependent oxidoreductase-like protein
MKFGVALQYFTAPIPATLGMLLRDAETAGFESVWCGESYGSDAFTPLAYVAACTSTMRVGTSISQMPARPPTTTAMAAMTLDHLSAGRVVLGLGSSGPQVAEGWYGQEYSRPLRRTRDYVSVVRATIARERPVAFEGEFYSLPLPDGSGLGKPLRSNLPPLRPDLPIHLAAEGPRNVSLAAEIADGWHALFFSPDHAVSYQAALDEGFAIRGGRPEHFEVVATAPVVIADDLEVAADRLRPTIALYVGGMGAPTTNFHNNVFARQGWEAEAATIQQLYLSGDRKGAIAAVPTAMMEQVALLGPAGKIREELSRWSSSGVDTLALVADIAELPRIADSILG